ncbi:MAG: site-2 protease family protein [bacterium]|nr:site-2 protease family protein [bacterium]
MDSPPPRPPYAPHADRQPDWPPPLYAPPAPPPSVPWVNIVLFLATVATTLIAGATLRGVNPFVSPWMTIREGFSFSFALLAILGVHEAGHFVMSRRWGVRATLPYFIPVPPPFIFGTMGAVIKMKSPVPHRDALFDIAVAGPLAGFLVAVPAVVVGLMLSQVQPHMPSSGANLLFGGSILFNGLVRLVLGVDMVHYDIILHPVAVAGWVGLFVTALNLLPFGQLDGGHIVYSLFGRRQTLVAGVMAAALVPMSLLWEGWLIWLALIYFVGFRHPPVGAEEIPLTRGRRALGFLTIGIFIITFTPIPLSIG